jgi:hypothetical protein
VQATAVIAVTEIHDNISLLILRHSLVVVDNRARRRRHHHHHRHHLQMTLH